MKNKLSIKSIFTYFFERYYFIVLFVYFLAFFYENIRVGVVSAITIVLLFILFLLSYKKKAIIRNAQIEATIYMIWSVVTIIWFPFNELGLGVLLKAISNTFFPILFVYFKPEDYDKFWKRFLIAYILCGICGMYLLIIRPSSYVTFCISRGFDYRRLSSFVGSIIMGTMGAISSIVSLKIIIDSRGKHGKLFYITVIIMTFFSMQRSAWVVLALTIIIAHYYVFFKYKIISPKYIIIEIIGMLLVCFLIRKQIYSVLRAWILVRKSQYGGKITIAKMFGERSGQWIRGINNSNIIIGSGFGSRGHKAASIGYKNYVADGSLVLILCETGILGIISFITVIVKSIIKGIRNFKALFLPLTIIVIFVLQSIGSNVFEQQLLAPLFWCAVAQIANEIKIVSFPHY